VPPHAAPATVPSAPAPAVQPMRLSSAQIARLPAATTFGTTPAAPPDPAPFAPETGTVLHPEATRVVYARPGGPPVAALPAVQLGSPTWVPVVQSQPEWDRVLLPARPNRSTGWIYLGGGGLETAYSSYRVQINLATHRLTIVDDGRRLGPWTVADGAASTPTPAGRTFLLASLAPPQPPRGAARTVPDSPRKPRHDHRLAREASAAPITGHLPSPPVPVGRSTSRGGGAGSASGEGGSGPRPCRTRLPAR
jgi:hypothetical protein